MSATAQHSPRTSTPHASQRFRPLLIVLAGAAQLPEPSRQAEEAPCMQLRMSSAAAAEPASGAPQSSTLAHRANNSRDRRDCSVDRSRSRSRSRSPRRNPAQDDAGSSPPSQTSPAVQATAASQAGDTGKSGSWSHRTLHELTCPDLMCSAISHLTGFPRTWCDDAGSSPPSPRSPVVHATAGPQAGSPGESGSWSHHTQHELTSPHLT